MTSFADLDVTEVPIDTLQSTARYKKYKDGWYNFAVDSAREEMKYGSVVLTLRALDEAGEKASQTIDMWLNFPHPSVCKEDFLKSAITGWRRYISATRPGDLPFYPRFDPQTKQNLGADGTPMTSNEASALRAEIISMVQNAVNGIAQDLSSLADDTFWAKVGTNKKDYKTVYSSSCSENAPTEDGAVVHTTKDDFFEE